MKICDFVDYIYSKLGKIKSSMNISLQYKTFKTQKRLKLCHAKGKVINIVQRTNGVQSFLLLLHGFLSLVIPHLKVVFRNTRLPKDVLYPRVWIGFWLHNSQRKRSFTQCLFYSKVIYSTYPFIARPGEIDLFITHVQDILIT